MMLSLILLKVIFPSKKWTEESANKLEYIKNETLTIFQHTFNTFFIELTYALILVLSLLIAVAYFTLAERKIMGGIQRRKGPNIAGFWGLLQPLTDGVKLLTKENIIPKKSNYFLFVLSPVITFTIAFTLWGTLPLTKTSPAILAELNMLCILALSSISVFGLLLAGWSSNSKYAFLGTLRSVAQMISYEIIISFIFVFFAMLTGSLNLYDIVLYQKNNWFIFLFFPLFLLFFIAMLAETNRAPFDLPEAEAEIVAGYNIEYSGIAFALFFLGEYANMLFMSTLIVLLFLGGWLNGLFAFILKITFFNAFFVITRASLPRIRYDQLLSLCWKYFLLFLLIFFILFFFFWFFLI